MHTHHQLFTPWKLFKYFNLHVDFFFGSLKKKTAIFKHGVYKISGGWRFIGIFMNCTYELTNTLRKLF